MSSGPLPGNIQGMVHDDYQPEDKTHRTLGLSAGVWQADDRPAQAKDTPTAVENNQKQGQAPD